MIRSGLVLYEWIQGYKTTLAYFLHEVALHNVNIPVWCIWCMLSARRIIGTLFCSDTVYRADAASGSVASTVK
jgi:hypothetical protein